MIYRFESPEAMPYSPNLPISLARDPAGFWWIFVVEESYSQASKFMWFTFLKNNQKKKKKDLWFLKFQEKCFLGKNVIHEAWYTYKNVLEMLVLPNFILSWQHIEAWGSQLTVGVIRLRRQWDLYKITECVSDSTGPAKPQARVLCATCTTQSSYYSIFAAIF